MSTTVDGTASVFVLSPAYTGGRRCASLLRSDATHSLARRLRDGGVPIGELFSFVSTTYFRGKLAYARRFAAPRGGGEGVYVIIPGEGLLPATSTVDRDRLARMTDVPVDPQTSAYRDPLVASTRRLQATLGAGDVVVFLGSLATDRYLGPLGSVLGNRLRIPRSLLGLGEMQRGSLLLRHADCGPPLELVTVDAAAES